MNETEFMYSIYDVLGILKFGILELTSKNSNEADTLENTRKKFKSNISKLNPLELEKMITYFDKMSKNLKSIVNNYRELGIKTTKEDEVTNEFNEFQLLVSFIINTYMSTLTPDFKIINAAIKIVNIAIEEIELLLPPVLDSADGVVLRKVTNDTNK